MFWKGVIVTVWSSSVCSSIICTIASDMVFGPGMNTEEVAFDAEVEDDEEVSLSG